MVNRNFGRTKYKRIWLTEILGEPSTNVYEQNKFWESQIQTYMSKINFGRTKYTF